MKGKDILFFDLDGTITDSKPGIFQSIRYALSFFDIEEPDDAKLMPFLGPPLTDCFQKAYHLTEEEALLALSKYREIYTKEGMKNLEVYEGVKTMLAHLKANGKTICLCTAKPLKYAGEILKNTGLFPLFDHVDGATLDESRNQKWQVMKHLIDENGFSKKSILMIGDRKDDILGASRNGVDAVGVLYGYGSFEELKDAGCVNFTKTVKETEELLLN